MQEPQTLAVIKKLNLSRRKLNDEQLLIELKALAGVCIIHDLDLSFNSLTEVGIDHLVDFLKQGVTISNLDVTANPISNTAVKKISELELKQCYLNRTKANINALAGFQNNHTILHLAYDRAADNEMYAEISANIETRLERNRLNFRANLVLNLIECCKIYTQNGTLFHQLQKPIFLIILMQLSDDYQHAYQYSQDYQTPLKHVINHILDSIIDLRTHKKVITPPTAPTLFYRACRALPLGNEKPQSTQFDTVATEQTLPRAEKTKSKAQCIIC